MGVSASATAEAVPARAVAGARYAEHQMRALDSEKPAGDARR